MFDLFKIEKNKNGVFVKMLSFNPQVWGTSQWSYLYVTGSYPRDDIEYAINFEVEEAAQIWIDTYRPK